MLKLYPMPKNVVEKAENFTFGDTVFFTVDAEFENSDFIKSAAELWNNYTIGKSRLIPVFEKTEGFAFLSFTKECAESFKTQDEYSVSVDREAVKIAYSKSIGLIHGFFTVLQLMSPYRRATGDFMICGAEISDSPELDFRAIHIAVFNSSDLFFLKRCIGVCAMLKCTHVCMEFFGSLKLESFPYFAWENSFSKDDIKPIVEYGRSLGLQFIPGFNHIGHAAMAPFRCGKHVILDQAPEYEEWYTSYGWTFDTDNPEVKAVIENVEKELCELFGEGDYFHIGCDESYTADERERELEFDEASNDSYINFVNLTAEKIKAMGRTPIMWGDMFLGRREFPYPYCANVTCRCGLNERNIALLDKDVIIADWQYNIKGDDEKTVDFFLDHGIKEDRLIVSPWDEFKNISGRIDIANKHGLKGAMGTCWDRLYNDPKFLTYTACLMWNRTKDPYVNYSNEAVKIYTATMMRKMLPPYGSYEKSGFRKQEF